MVVDRISKQRSIIGNTILGQTFCDDAMLHATHRTETYDKKIHSRIKNSYLVRGRVGRWNISKDAVRNVNQRSSSQTIGE